MPGKRGECGLEKRHVEVLGLAAVGACRVRG